MKHAIYKIRVVEIQCPYCKEGLENSRGSFEWDAQDFLTDPAIENGTIVCPVCQGVIIVDSLFKKIA